ncbi:UNVERIFIED_CONTAM: hypothetical protein PYX00_003067 [Menopon gallinae]|uniref:Uncharacterized protein n=1 Tax=Menopon gallinae TaxID=328185 RepID=A0AAW2HYY1_9NEOP
MFGGGVVSRHIRHDNVEEIRTNRARIFFDGDYLLKRYRVCLKWFLFLMAFLSGTGGSSSSPYLTASSSTIPQTIPGNNQLNWWYREYWYYGPKFGGGDVSQHPRETADSATLQTVLVGPPPSAAAQKQPPELFYNKKALKRPSQIGRRHLPEEIPLAALLSELHELRRLH